MAAQIMSVDKLRLKSQLYALSKADILTIENAIKMHLEPPQQSLSFACRIALGL